jgi:hypothetical protein
MFRSQPFEVARSVLAVFRLRNQLFEVDVGVRILFRVEVMLRTGSLEMQLPCPLIGLLWKTEFRWDRMVQLSLSKGPFLLGCKRFRRISIVRQ